MSLRPWLFAAFGALACARSVSVETAPATTTTSTVVATTPVPSSLSDTSAWVEQTLASLTLRQRIAQMTMFWMLGDYTSVDDSTFREVVRWVQDEGVGGLTMSLGTPIEVAAKINYL